MKISLRRIVTLFFILVILACGILGGMQIKESIENSERGIGNVLDTYKGVDVFFNGDDYVETFGKHYSSDGYYYGYKWQCVEYVKRFYKDALNHEMKDGYGHAKDFFDESVGQGELNEKRGLIQYRNGEDEKPKEDDLLVFTDTTYGHVVIISEVGDDYIEVVQQNMGKESRDKFDLSCIDGKYYVGGKREAACWLRLEE